MDGEGGGLRNMDPVFVVQRNLKYALLPPSPGTGCEEGPFFTLRGGGEMHDWADPSLTIFSDRT